MPEFRLLRYSCFWLLVIIDLITVLSPQLTPTVISETLFPEVQNPSAFCLVRVSSVND